MRSVLPVLMLLIVLAGALPACGEESGGADGVQVVATTAQMADVVREVAGNRAGVRALIPAGADPHDHEVRPSDVEALAEADLVVRSGGEIDEWVSDALDAAGAEAPVLDVLERVEPLAGEAGTDPHWWHDASSGAAAAVAVADALAEADSPSATVYREAGRAYERRLRELDRAIAACWEQVPARRRKLVTTHDALGYYARRYGLEVIGAVLPSTSTAAQASAGSVDELVATIRREEVPAIFAESSVSSDVEQAIARETGARIGGELHVDGIAREGAAATYAGALAVNTQILVGGLTGDEVACSLPR